jgi:Flp pilus assembly protein TadD
MRENHFAQGMGLQVATLLADEEAAVLRPVSRVDAIHKPATNALSQGLAMFQQGRSAEAAVFLGTWIKQNPQDAEAHHVLAASLFAVGRYQEAEAAAAQAVKLDPDLVQAWVSLSTIQTAQGQRGYPLRSLLQAIERSPGDINLRHRMGMLLLDHAHNEQAIRTFELVLKARPKDREATTSLAMAFERSGQLERAYDLLAPQIRSGPTLPQMVTTWGSVCRRLKRPAEGVPPLKRMLGIPGLADNDRLMALYELGHIYDALGQADQAWSAITEANDLQPGRFDPEVLVDRTNRIIATYGANMLRNSPRSTNPSRLPIFIFGSPRSGTSLVEQILASHSKVFGAGELGDIQATESIIEQKFGAPFPAGAIQMDEPTATAIGDWYLQRRRAQAPDATRVTDKMPINHEYLGLISQVLPGATLIRCVRDPRDIALSCFFQNFKAPLAWSNKIPWIGVFLEQYERLMLHWEAVLPTTIHSVRYEALVTDPESQTRSLLDACGLEWEPGCLEFHKNKRTVATASYAQATRPLYQSSMGRAERYQAWMSEAESKRGS